MDITFNQVSYDPRSYERNLCNCECRSLKNSGLQRGSNLNFSGYYIRNCINCIHNCEGHSLLGFTSAVQCMKDFIYNFTLLVTWQSCISLRRKLANAGGRIFSKKFFPAAFTPLITSWNLISALVIFSWLDSSGARTFCMQTKVMFFFSLRYIFPVKYWKSQV